MPNGWTRIGTPEELKRLLPKPAEFRTRVDELVEEAGAIVGHLYFKPDKSAAFVLTHVPPANADAVFQQLDAKLGPTKRIYSVEEVERSYSSE